MAMPQISLPKPISTENLRHLPAFLNYQLSCGSKSGKRHASNGELSMFGLIQLLSYIYPKPIVGARSTILVIP